ncbi:MAG: AMP-dependent synthetase/ligase [Bacteroidales bacterium]|nr:AMP-dependent synthetase/ligase [Bacteroidales bacterium]
MATITRIFDILEELKTEHLHIQDVLAYKKDGQWIQFSAGDYVQHVNQVSKSLIALGIKKGDKVATILANSPQWNFLDMGLMQIGAVQVPIYSTISNENFKHIFTEADAQAVFISTLEMYHKIQSVIGEVKSIKSVFVVEESEEVTSWDAFLKLGDAIPQSMVDQIKPTIGTNDLASIIYTSGTTGIPKGVMLSHGNFISNFLALSDIIIYDMVHRVMSFLPLCHVYERVLNYMYQHMGISVYYAESIEKLSDNLREVHPEMFCAVPRVIEKSFDKIMAKGRELKGIKRLLFFWAVNLGYQYELNKANGPWYEFKRKIADKLIYSKWRNALGGKLRIIVSGGATLQPRLARVFWAARIKIMEGYGLTETSPVIAVANFRQDGACFGTVGKVLPGVTMTLADDGEILCKGPNVMLGYYKHPQLTSEVIDQDGWFHTGDIGMMVDDVYLKITDRKKEMFKTSGGKYIAPQVIEVLLKASPFIDGVMVVGEHKNYAAAIIIPDFQHLRSWCRVKEHPYASDAEAIKDQRIVDRIWREVEQVNATLDKTEQIKKVALLHKPWTVENGDLSQTLKLRRRYLMEKHRDVVEGLY